SRSPTLLPERGRSVHSSCRTARGLPDGKPRRHKPFRAPEPPYRAGQRRVSWAGRHVVSYTCGTLTEVQGVRGLGTPLTAPEGVSAGVSTSDDVYRQIFERNRTVQLLIDPTSGRIVDANPAACRFYGYTREELASRKISDISTLPASEVNEAMSSALTEPHNPFHFPHPLPSPPLPTL